MGCLVSLCVRATFGPTSVVAFPWSDDDRLLYIAKTDTNEKKGSEQEMMGEKTFVSKLRARGPSASR